jgi:preprotein translocase SecE subunit
MVRNEKEMASNLATAEGDSDDDRDEQKSASSTPARLTAPASKGSFFTIYKRGQGKWTRLGTVFVALILGVMTSYTLFNQLLPYINSSNGDIQHDRTVRSVLLGACIAFLAVFLLFVYRVTNKPRNVDFLIATDSEMKKVNWTTGNQLMGSTRVVILFLFFVAIFLSVVDLLFYELFHLLRVLQ